MARIALKQYLDEGAGARGVSHGSPILPVARRPALPQAGGQRLPPLTLKHFGFARGIRCDRAIPDGAEICGEGRLVLTKEHA